ncbi:hypothetical protein CEUSTIGMA_g10144.t1 [Chlamydomonas eustigma]|uniref:Uncharacterized protein n=1 Tax=Chlamydomonas eustigma TaxID=1157962 RepID=A0A250XI17_9CHLO|nr:hypothetical protein CEUSTIGMA_g10144.t1 [Chlamydomonas eustigma]|eukprot:GAX82718.1 hypothetical protein CEUSTIGMA_g10144.t1 [Chlamydomonas eustigma]
MSKTDKIGESGITLNNAEQRAGSDEEDISDDEHDRQLDNQPESAENSNTIWQYEEVTGDGGVGLTFNELQDPQANERELNNLYIALNDRVKAVNESDDDEEDTALYSIYDHDALVGEQRYAGVESQPTASGICGGLEALSDVSQQPDMLTDHVLPPSRFHHHRPQVRLPSFRPLSYSENSITSSSKDPPRLPSFRPRMTTQERKMLKLNLSQTIRRELMRGQELGRTGSVAAPEPSTVAALRMAMDNYQLSSLTSEPWSHNPNQALEDPDLAHQLSIRVSSVDGKIKPVNIVMLIVGTRGDVQPFIGIALRLKEYGHRVRIASHKVYRSFVSKFGLEFYPLGGDPKVLSEFVVKHRGMNPGLNLGDAMEQRNQMKLILKSTWGACVEPDPETPNVSFVAEAIVANPPAYGHLHCAEKLNVPLHIVFTMPWSPTIAFPSPFARFKTTIGVQNSKAREMMNWLSYFAMDDLAWLGIADIVKRFRRKKLGLKNSGKHVGSHGVYYSKVPLTYIWSPSLVPRPDDWPSYLEVVGFVNVELKNLIKYNPPPALQDFLNAGPPPVYVGFGSLVVDDPEKLTRDFIKAIQATGLRAIIQRGWGGLGAGVEGDVPGVLFIDQAPHDWLFEQCCAVIHHGGAGTTACGLYCGKPTFIVPFFGDQPFWGAACFHAGVGPEPVPIDDLNSNKIIEALKTLILPVSLENARLVQRRMKQENGIEGAVDHIHRTIYGALLTGKTWCWMKQNSHQGSREGQVPSLSENNHENLQPGGGTVSHGFMDVIKSRGVVTAGGSAVVFGSAREVSDVTRNVSLSAVPYVTGELGSLEQPSVAPVQSGLGHKIFRKISELFSRHSVTHL